MHHVLCSLMAEKQRAGRVRPWRTCVTRARPCKCLWQGSVSRGVGTHPCPAFQFLAFSPDGWLGGFPTGGLDHRATVGPPHGLLSCSISPYNPAAHLPSGPAGLLTWDAYFSHFCPGFLEGILTPGWVQGFLGPELTLITLDWNGVS